MAGSVPATSARNTRPSLSVTVTRSASAITCWLVRMKPLASMMNPLPDPSRGAPGSSVE